MPELPPVTRCSPHVAFVELTQNSSSTSHGWQGVGQEHHTGPYSQIRPSRAGPHAPSNGFPSGQVGRRGDGDGGTGGGTGGGMGGGIGGGDGGGGDGLGGGGEGDGDDDGDVGIYVVGCAELVSVESWRVDDAQTLSRKQKAARNLSRRVPRRERLSRECAPYRVVVWPRIVNGAGVR